jgi:hypothetical protein
MIFRALDANGDWTLGSGKQSFLTAESAINANIKTALLVLLGECFWNTQFGIDWMTLLGSKGADATINEILLQTRSVIVSCYGVSKINSVDATRNLTTRKVFITYNINTIYSSQVTSTIQTPSLNA